MSEFDRQVMLRALEFAARGRGFVEPNPLVGCVIVREGRIVGRGWHQRFGGPHAEVEALADAGDQARGADLYVTLEPCCHHGKTPPCTQAILQAGVTRVVAAMADPFPQVAGDGLAGLAAAGVRVEVGCCEAEARRLNAPYLTLLGQGRPWVIAKWAMTLDGRIATRTGDSRWISSEASRAIVHQLRGRVDAILVGRGTAEADDPLLTARPAGPRTALRIVADRRAKLASTSQLVRTGREVPVLVAAGPEAPAEDIARLRSAGCEVFPCAGASDGERLQALLAELGRRRFTNLLVEGGAGLLGAFFDARLIDEVQVFIAPKLVGGSAAPGPLGGLGIAAVAETVPLADLRVEFVGTDLHLRGVIGENRG
ncbi:MAG: bifunctional diaminohydroxyphosphoribosylaminopyrimidine deaminase/5-amino-6-(5-phosphoribosylamino)uracil reductase RibD [Pirellulales bacterium]